MDTNTNPKISIVIPTHNMDKADFFLRRLMQSLEAQTYRNFEIVITKDGKMAENTNAGIKKSKGDIIKIVYMDDYLAHRESLENLVKNWKGGWLATGCLHDAGDGNLFNPHPPSFHGISDGQNTIGSPSVVAFENKDPLLFDENMTWLLDVDYYQRLYKRYGAPTLVDSMDVVIGVHPGQMTHILTNEEKANEEKYFNEKHGI